MIKPLSDMSPTPPESLDVGPFLGHTRSHVDHHFNADYASGVLALMEETRLAGTDMAKKAPAAPPQCPAGLPPGTPKGPIPSHADWLRNMNKPLSDMSSHEFFQFQFYAASLFGNTSAADQIRQMFF